MNYHFQINPSLNLDNYIRSHTVHVNICGWKWFSRIAPKL